MPDCICCYILAVVGALALAGIVYVAWFAVAASLRSARPWRSGY